MFGECDLQSGWCGGLAGGPAQKRGQPRPPYKAPCARFLSILIRDLYDIILTFRYNLITDTLKSQGETHHGYGLI